MVQQLPYRKPQRSLPERESHVFRQRGGMVLLDGIPIFASICGNEDFRNSLNQFEIADERTPRLNVVN